MGEAPNGRYMSTAYFEEVTPAGTILFAECSPVINATKLSLRMDHIEISDLSIIDADKNYDHVGILFHQVRWSDIIRVHCDSLEIGIEITQGSFYNRLVNCFVDKCSVGVYIHRGASLNSNSNTLLNGRAQYCDLGYRQFNGTLNVLDNFGFSGCEKAIQLNTSVGFRVVNCRIETGSVGIELSGTNKYFNFISNYFDAITTKFVGSLGDRPNVKYNSGYVTENKGTAVISNGLTSTGNIAHGLSGTPTLVLAFGQHADTEDLYCSSKDSNNIVIDCIGAVGGDRTIFWYAEYNP